VRTRIGRWYRLELKQLDLERISCSFECEGDVLRFHARHAHVPSEKATVDRRDVSFSEAREREELDRRAGVCHRDSKMIWIEYHIVTPCNPRVRSVARIRLPGEPPPTCPPALAQGYQFAPSHGRRVGLRQIPHRAKADLERLSTSGGEFI
jgi:hypothetical protein